MLKVLSFLLVLGSSPLCAAPQTDQTSTVVGVDKNGDLKIDGNSKNIFVIEGPITNGTRIIPVTETQSDLGPITFAMKRALDQKQEVVLIIDSPGGIVEEITTNFLDTLDEFSSENVPVTCIVTGMAASLAAIIYSKCANRYATASSRVMWHSIGFGFEGKLNEPTALRIYKDFHILNEHYMKNLKLYFTPEYFEEHFLKEDFVTAVELEKVGKGFLRLVRGIAQFN